MDRLIIFLTASALSFAGALWVYLGVRRKEAARAGVLVGAVFLAGGLTAHAFAGVLGWNTNSKAIGAIGIGTGILMVGLGGIFHDRRSAGGNGA